MRITSFLLAFIVVFLTFTAESFSQLRDDLPSQVNRTGNVTNPADASNQNKLFGLVDFRMSHSYEMTMSNFGGNTFNQNYYTNTMQLFFNPNLTGRVDLSVAHSPFGNGFMGQNQGPQFFVRNAELNYRFSENSAISIQFQQIPAGSFMNPFSPHYSPYGRNTRMSNRFDY